MRRPFRLVALSVVLLVGACSDQPDGITQPNATERPSADVVGIGCPTVPTAAQILTQVNLLLPRSPIRTTVIALVNSLPSRFQNRLTTIVRTQIFLIQDLVLKSFYAGRLNGGTSSDTFDRVLELFRLLYCYVGLTPPTFPSTTSGVDIVVGVVFPNSPTTTIATPSQHGAVTIPAGAAPAPTTIVIMNLPDEPGPLLTSLDQYPLFYEFSGTTTSGPVTFLRDVTAGVCLRDNIPVADANLRLAHNVGTNFGDVEVLPRPANSVVPGLNCASLGGESPGFLRSPTRLGAAGGTGWTAVSRVLAPLGRALLPESLHASSLALLTVGVGGTTKKFSPFGVVDVTSNPGTLGFNPDAGTFSELSAAPGSPVTPAPSVSVSSKNGDPIVNVPVLFAVTGGGGTINNGVTSVTVRTGPDGIASLANWTLGSGTNTVSATPPAGTQVSAPPTAYRPQVAFAPASVTFTANGAASTIAINYGASGWKYYTLRTDPPSEFFSSPWYLPDFDDSNFSTGAAPFGSTETASCSVFTTHPPISVWEGMQGVRADTASGSGLLLRRTFTAAPGSSLVVEVAIDNDIQVFIDGQDVTDGGNGGVVFTPASNGEGGVWNVPSYVNVFRAHDGCAQRGDGTFSIPSAYLGESTTHTIAVYAHDWGGAAYVDLKVTVLPAPPPIQ